MRQPAILALASLIALGACTRQAPAPADPVAPVAPPAPAKALDTHVAPWTLPVSAGAQPDLVVAPDGALLLAWIETTRDGHRLRFARHDGRAWSTPRTIAAGSDWFVNWADTPHIAATPDGALWAHWLRKSAAATYAYDVVLSRSADGGATWSRPVRVNDDGTPTEHGFVSLWPAAHDRIGIAWLDGRETAGAGHGAHAGPGGGGAMTLRSANFDAALARHGEARLDDSTCDCCQTGVAVADGVPVLVYRDRAPGEIRDIVATRYVDGRWTPARTVHPDRWHMPACPVNGPAATARGGELFVGWYTMADEVARVQVGRSTDAGATFAPPLVVDRGPPVLGRVTIAQHGGRAWIAWLREAAGAQSLWLARIAADGRTVEERRKVADLQGRGRGTGVPRLVEAGDGLRLVWTDLVEGAPRLQGVAIAVR